MTTEKKAPFIWGVLLGLGVYKQMQTNQFIYYGLIGGELQIKAYIYMTCKVIAPNNIKEASKLLAETIAIETNNGNTKDLSSNYGEGLTQFDKATFEDIKKYYTLPKFVYLVDKIKKYLLIDVINFEYSNLRKSPLASIVFARLLYLRVPENIPTTKAERWLYYKKWFNSYLGKSTEAQYMTASKMAVFV